MIQSILPKQLSAEVDCVLYDAEQAFRTSSKSDIETRVAEVAGGILGVSGLPEDPELVKAVAFVLLSN